MPTIDPRAIPEDYYSFSLKELDTFITAIERRLEAREVMRIEQAAEFLSISVRNLNRMCQIGKLPYHHLDGLRGKIFLRSELLDFIKKSGKT